MKIEEVDGKVLINGLDVVGKLTEYNKECERLTNILIQLNEYLEEDGVWSVIEKLKELGWKNEKI